MEMLYRWSLGITVVAVVALAAGCGGGSSGPRPQGIQSVRPAASSAVVAPAQGQYLGDMDGDGQPSVGDAIKILRIVVGLDDDDPCADANENGGTDVGDAIKVLRCVVGLDQWPIGSCATRTISGTVTEQNFVVGAGERVACDGDVVIECDTATIQGVLFSLPGGQDGSDITINAQNDVTVAGSIAAGEGQSGLTDGDGGDGGDVTINSANGDITVGTPGGVSSVPQQAGDPVIGAGDAGDGGEGQLGGAGGKGGTVTLDAINGTVTIHQAPSLLQIGNGGNGGRGVVGGQDLLTFTIPEQLTNGGGDSGSLVVHCNDLVGVDAQDSGQTMDGKPVYVGVLDDGVGSGAKGGDAGDFYFGVDPDTGESTWPEHVPPAAVTPRQSGAIKTELVIGADGGHGWQGGHGAPVAVDRSGHRTPMGADGRNLDAWGGGGGQGGRTQPGTHKSLAGPCVLLLGNGPIVVGGDGGNAVAVGYPGGPGEACSPGCRGGRMVAYGGDGGCVHPNLLPDKYLAPGRGGKAYATGGPGGLGGSCCNPPQPGPCGGSGGYARAYGGVGGWLLPTSAAVLGAGGNTKATGGMGGKGGDGDPPGTGGEGGAATASTPGLGDPSGTNEGQHNGADGPDGDPCGLDPTGVSGMLSTHDGKLVANRRVDLCTEAGVCVDSVVSGANGKYAFSGVTPGQYDIVPVDAATPNYWDPGHRFVTKQDGVHLIGQDFVRRVGGQFTVTVPVQDQNGAPMADIVIRLDEHTGRIFTAWSCIGLTEFIGIWSGHSTLRVQSPPPAGFQWFPYSHDLYVPDHDVTTEPFRLVPE